MTMTYCRNCQRDVHITDRDCCDDPNHRTPDSLKRANAEPRDVDEPGRDPPDVY